MEATKYVFNLETLGDAVQLDRFICIPPDLYPLFDGTADRDEQFYLAARSMMPDGEKGRLDHFAQELRYVHMRTRFATGGQGPFVLILPVGLDREKLELIVTDWYRRSSPEERRAVRL